MFTPDLTALDIDLATSGGRRRAAVAACAVVAAAVGVVGVIGRIADLGHRAGDNARRDYAEREFAGGNSLNIDKVAYYAARSLIPADASYRLVIGPSPPDANSLTVSSLPGYTRYFLMPRRPDEHAEWVICYGCDPAGLAGYTAIWDGGRGVSIGKVTP